VAVSGGIHCWGPYSYCHFNVMGTLSGLPVDEICLSTPVLSLGKLLVYDSPAVCLKHVHRAGTSTGLEYRG
jgi:hypothetical protein